MTMDSTRISILTSLSLMRRIDLCVKNLTAFSTERGPEAAAGDAYSGFNACHYTGDDAGHVAECRSVLAQELGLSEVNFIIPRQTHSDCVRLIDHLPVADELLEGMDALVTDMERVALCINTADCVPVVLHDARAGVVAVAHCGWRGVVNALLPNTLAVMERLGAHPKDIHAAMGPSICADCFEVGEEVAESFREEFPGVAGIVLTGQGKPHVNLGVAIAEKLRRGGVAVENISLPPFCSRCNPERFFSARALGVASGRTLTVAVMGAGGAGMRR